MEHKSIAEIFDSLTVISNDYEMLSDTKPFTRERCISAAIGGLISLCKAQQELIEQQEKRIARLESSPVQMGYGSL